jgi:hypothetical protein
MVFHVAQGTGTDIFMLASWAPWQPASSHYAAYQNTDFTNGHHYYWAWKTNAGSAPAYGYDDPLPNSYNHHWGYNEHVLPYFDKTARYDIELWTANGGYDRCDTQIEFRKANGDPVFGLHFRDDVDNSYSTITQYGPSLSNLNVTAAEHPGFQGAAYVGGYFTFNDTTIYYTNTRGGTDSYVDSFTYSCDVASISQIYYKTNYNLTVGSGLYCWMYNVGAP